MKLNKGMALCCCNILLIQGLAYADLQPISEVELAEISGQAIAEVVDLVDPGGVGFNTNETRFLRLRTGAKIEISANIEKVIFGEYSRNDQYTSYSGSFYRDSSKYYQNISGGAPPGADIGVTNGADVIIENLSLGYIDNGSIVPFKFENPYMEFVLNSSNELIGFRTGFENQNGHMGNYSEAGVVPSDPNRNGGVLSVSGNLNLLAGSAALIGYSVVDGVARANLTPVEGGLLAGILAPNSTQTLGDINNKDSQEFYLSFNTMPIYYPTISGIEANQFVNGNRRAAIPGVALNITDGTALTLPQAFGTLGGGIAKLSNCFGSGNKGSC